MIYIVIFRFEKSFNRVYSIIFSNVNKLKTVYYNKNVNQNHKIIKLKNINNYKGRAFKHSSTDNILKNNKGDTLHKINNKFLINPYFVRNSRYINRLNNINYTKEEKKEF